MNVSICALNSDLQRHKPLKVFQSYKVTRITKREEEGLRVGFFLFFFFQVAMTSLSSSSLDTSL